MNTTRMYPRTLAQAFPRDYAASIEPPSKEERRQLFAERMVMVTCLACLVALGILAVFGWLPGGQP